MCRSAAKNSTVVVVLKQEFMEVIHFDFQVVSSQQRETATMSSSTTNNTSDMEIPTIFGLPGVTPTFDPSVTDVVPTMHTSSYPAINPALNPLLSQAGKTVLITGATAGIGFAMAKSFVTASASKVIITGRRQERLDEAVGLLRQHAKELRKQTEVVSEKSDAANMEEIDTL